MNIKAPSDFPMSLVDLAETLGIRVALKLMQEFGGRELKLPIKPRQDHPIIKVFGETDGNALCQYLGGEMIYIPHGRARRSSRAEIAELHAKGKDRGEIARLLGISQRHVRRAANGAGPDNRQSDLFKDL